MIIWPGLVRPLARSPLATTIDDYLGRFDFRGKRCLDIGTASGYLTFEMERRGALSSTITSNTDQGALRTPRSVLTGLAQGSVDGGRAHVPGTVVRPGADSDALWTHSSGQVYTGASL